MAEPTGEVVYQLDVRDHRDYEPEQQKAISGFLTAHGIDPLAFMLGNTIYVRQRNDGSLWLDTWRAVGNNANTAPLCPHCPACIKQERVEVPLAAPVPRIESAYVNHERLVAN